MISNSQLTDHMKAILIELRNQGKTEGSWVGIEYQNTFAYSESLNNLKLLGFARLLPEQNKISAWITDSGAAAVETVVVYDLPYQYWPYDFKLAMALIYAVDYPDMISNLSKAFDLVNFIEASVRQGKVLGYVVGRQQEPLSLDDSVKLFQEMKERALGLCSFAEMRLNWRDLQIFEPVV